MQIFNKDCRIASCDQGIRQASLFLQPIRPLPLWGRGGGSNPLKPYFRPQHDLEGSTMKYRITEHNALPHRGRGGVGAAIRLNRTSVPNMIWREAQ